MSGHQTDLEKGEVSGSAGLRFRQLLEVGREWVVDSPGQVWGYEQAWNVFVKQSAVNKSVNSWLNTFPYCQWSLSLSLQLFSWLHSPSQLPHYLSVYLSHSHINWSTSSCNWAAKLLHILHISHCFSFSSLWHHGGYNR